ncbi:restriction endonuclease subunit S [Vibrio cholerae]
MSWPLVKLGDVAKLINGDRGKNYPSKGSFVDKGIPFINAGCLSNEHTLIDAELNFITEEKFDSLRSGKIEKGDILFCLRGSLGKFALVDTNIKGAIASSLVIIRANEKVCIDYLKHYLGSFLCQREIQAYENGAAQPNLSATDLKSFQIPLPPLDEQKRIAAILDKADAIRQKRKQAIELADEFLRSVFLDMFGDPVTNPKGWEQVPLSTLSDKILNGTTPKGGSDVYVEKGIAFLRSQNVWKKRIDLDDIVYLDDVTHAKMSKSSLKYKDILITKTGRINTDNSSLGRAAIYYGKDDEANINGHVYLVRLKPDNVHEFIEFILTTKEYRDHIRSVCVGGIDKRQLNKNHIEEFPIICPPSSQQQRFVKVLHQSQKVMDNYKEQLVEAQNNFSALTQKAFSGQL